MVKDNKEKDKIKPDKVKSKRTKSRVNRSVAKSRIEPDKVKAQSKTKNASRCALLRKKFKEDQFTYCIENGILQDSSEPSNDNTNVVNALQEPFVVEQDPGKNSSQSPPQINHHCCYECGDLLEYIFAINVLDRTTIYYDDDDEDYAIAVTPSLLIEEPDNSLSMGDEHLDTIPATESDEFINSSVENLVPIPSESEGIPDNMCHVPFHDNSPPLDVSKDQFEDFFDSNNESTLTDDDSFFIDNIEYVEASPPNFEIVSSELNVNLLIANIEALNDNPTPSFDLMTKSSSTSLNSLLEETNTFDNSFPEFEIFCCDLEEISSGSTTTRSDISLPKYEAFYDDHVKEISSGSTTTHFDSFLYDSFIFDLSINPFLPVGRSDFYEFADELTHIISLPEYDCFCFKNEPNSEDFTMDAMEDIFLTREPRVHNALPTHPTLQLNLDFILSSESLYPSRMKIPFLIPASAVIISLLLYRMYLIGVELSFKVLNESLMDILFSTCSPMDQ
nr:hypothetical protein [Tanacetum cinerariifolium]